MKTIAAVTREVEALEYGARERVTDLHAFYGHWLRYNQRSVSAYGS